MIEVQPLGSSQKCGTGYGALILGPELDSTRFNHVSCVDGSDSSFAGRHLRGDVCPPATLRGFQPSSIIASGRYV